MKILLALVAVLIQSCTPFEIYPLKEESKGQLFAFTLEQDTKKVGECLSTTEKWIRDFDGNSICVLANASEGVRQLTCFKRESKAGIALKDISQSSFGFGTYMMNRSVFKDMKQKPVTLYLYGQREQCVLGHKEASQAKKV